MSRSHKKNPGGGHTTSMSDKKGKVIDHRRYRHYANARVRDGRWDEVDINKVKENPWNWPKDGKQYWPEGRYDREFMGK